MDLLNEVEIQRKNIITDSYSSTWRELLSLYKAGELKIDPDYQRLFRWSIESQTRFIESLLLGIPSPAIFLAENKNGDTEILDGLQRFTTLIRLFAEEIFDEKEIILSDSTSEKNTNNIYSPTTLCDAPLITKLEGLSAKTLPDILVKTIKSARVTVILITRESDENARMEVFKRLNKYGALLSDQEIRNAMAMLYGKEFPKKLKEIANLRIVQNAISPNESMSKQMGVEELVLRMLAFSIASDKFKHSLSNFLDDVMFLASANKLKISKIKYNNLIKTFELINQSFKDGEAFKFEKKGFSTNLFDIIATGVFFNISTLTSTTLKSKHASLLISKDLKKVVGAGSNSKAKLYGRIELGKSWFA